MSVKTRFAPSPTGSLHIGGARTALFSWLFARRNGGEFILRIEDTDAGRSDEKFFSEIFDSLRWLGIDWDDSQTLRQSERPDIYREYADKLLASGDAEREEGTALRFKVPRNETVVVDDKLHGKTAFETDNIEDFIILRSNGMPTYNFACAIDDALSGITHVIRGDEHLVNTPKQILILRALGLPVPHFVHLPVILAPDGSKLSKRHGAVSVADFRKRGMLPSALANYIARLGWSCGDEEIFTMAELEEKFDLGGLGTSPSHFDEKKMLWVNGVHIREGKTDVIEPLRREFAGMGLDVSPADAEKAFSLQRERAETVVEMAEKGAFLFRDEVEFDAAAREKFINGETLPALEAVLGAFSVSGGGFDADGVKAALSSVTEETGMKLKQLAQPLRVALTGKTESPGIFEVVATLGRTETVKRVERAVNIAKSGGRQ